MITPSKAVNLQQSALGQATIILAYGEDSRDVIALYHELAQRFASVDDFILTLDLLYVLGRIDLDFPTRTLTYAG